VVFGRVAGSVVVAAAGAAGVVVLCATGALAAPGAARHAAVTTKSFYASPHGHGNVCSHADPCKSIQAAINKGNNDFGDDVVVHAAAGTYHQTICFDTCASGKLPEMFKLTLEGASERSTIIDAGGANSVFSIGVDTPDTFLRALTLTDGNAPASSAGGGGIAVDGGTLTVDDCLVTGNTAERSVTGGGGGIWVDGGSLTLQNSVVRDNTALTGGGLGVMTGGKVLVEDSTIADNSATDATPISGQPGGQGGGVYAGLESTHPLSIESSTVTGNTATGDPQGGGVYLNFDNADVTGSTVSDNSAPGTEGVGGAFYVVNAHLHLGADILDGNAAPVNTTCGTFDGGTIGDDGHNVVDDTTCPLGSTSRMSTDAAIGLGPLAANGGPTPTERIAKTSSAYDVVPRGARVGSTTFCRTSDQRGVDPRIQGPAARCSAGAFQFAPPHITGISPHSGRPGSLVTIRGYGFSLLAPVTFGSTRASVRVRGGIVITATVPRRNPGTVTVRVRNPDGSATRTFKVLRALP
jgi:hypothetical protein